MTIPSVKILKKNASERLNSCPNEKAIVLIYIGIISAMGLLVAAASFLLSRQISQTGGLSNMGLRSVLSTVQTVLPMIQSIVLMCLGLGYTAAMLRICREQYASYRTLKLGFDRIWLLLRCRILESILYIGVVFLTFWLALQIFLLTPLSTPIVELIQPLTETPGFSPEMLTEPDFLAQTFDSMIPFFFLFGLLFAAVAIPLSYSLRMVSYIIIDKPGIRALAAIRESQKMMRGSRLRLFKLDLHLWWWYVPSMLVSVICYGDVLLPRLGITLPFSEDVAYFVFYILSLVIQFILFCLLRNRVEVIYAQVYEARRPREKSSGVVLGNIFQM